MNLICSNEKKLTGRRLIAAVLCIFVFLACLPMPQAFAAEYVSGTYKTTSALNLRSGRGTQYSRIALLPKGVQVSVDNIQNEWGCITYNGKTGYVSMNYMELVKAAQTASGTYKTTAALNCRAGRGTQYVKVILIPGGVTLKVTDISNGWGYVTYNGKSGYVSMDYMKKVTSSGTSSGNTSSGSVSSGTSSGSQTPAGNGAGTYVTTDALNCRKGPSTTYSRVALLPKGAQVTVTSVTNGWGYITYRGTNGYVSMDYLKKVETEEDASSGDTSSDVPSDTSSGNASSNNTSSGSVSSGDASSGSTSSGNTSSNPTGNTSSSSTSSGSSSGATVTSGTYKTTAALNLRKGAGTGYARLLVIPKGATLKATNVANGWGYVTYNGTSGYVSMDYMQLVTAGGTSSGSGNTSSGGSNSSGYASGTYRTTAALNLRKGAGTGYAKILVIPMGASVEVISVSGDWGYVNYNGTKGYVSMAYLQTSTGNYANFSALKAKYPTGSKFSKAYTNGWYATGCYGFLLQIAYEWSGQVAPVAWNKITSAATLSSLKPGDIIAGSKHSIMVTGVEGTRIQFVHSNWKYVAGGEDNIVRWDEWTTVNALKGGTYIGAFKYVLRKK